MANPTRVKGKRSENRVPVMMTDEELEVLDRYCAKEYPGASRSFVIRLLIEKGIKQ